MVGSPTRTASAQNLQSMVPDSIPDTPAKSKADKLFFFRGSARWSNVWGNTQQRPNSVYAALAFIATCFVLYYWCFPAIGVSSTSYVSSYLQGTSAVSSISPSSSFRYTSSWGGPAWERRVRDSSQTQRPDNMVVLVTGAAGFVGYHLSLALKARGDGVVGLDNFNSYYDPALKRARDSRLRDSGVFVVEGDINDGPLLARLFELVRFTHVAHLAAQAGVRYALENPASYVHSNVAGWVSLLEACRKTNPQPAIVWASSSSVYGLNKRVPFSESDRTDQPASLYAATKKAGEEIAHSYNHIYGLSLTALRFFTVYGPWGRPDMAYFFFTKNILEGRPIKLFLGPNKTDLARDFTYIDDIVRGCISSLDTAEPSTGSGGRKRSPAQLRVFNLGNTRPVPVPELVNLLESHLGVRALRELIKMPRNGDVPFTHANVSRARAELGYSPSTDLDSGLREFVHWYLGYYGRPRRVVGPARAEAVEKEQQQEAAVVGSLVRSSEAEEGAKAAPSAGMEGSRARKGPQQQGAGRGKGKHQGRRRGGGRRMV